MHKQSVKRSSKAGLSPGTIIYTGKHKVDRAIISLLQYDELSLNEQQETSLEDAVAFRDQRVNWINISGLHDVRLIEEIGKAFSLHPLTLEDIASTGQRPKIEYYDNYVFIVLRMLTISTGGSGLQDEQISMVLGKDFLLTFQERPGDVFNPLRERIRLAKGRIRKLGVDYLSYALLDVLVDSYFLVLENYSDEVEQLEEAVFNHPSPEHLARIGKLKRETLFLRRAVWPLRELISALQREESSLISGGVLTFMRDVYDHSVQIIEIVETLREMISGLHDAYLSTLSFRMNEIMKVLTIIATIFIPLSFLVGVYGMNFDVMPELHFRWGYPLLWLFMLSAVMAMLLYFRRKRWL